MAISENLVPGGPKISSKLKYIIRGTKYFDIFGPGETKNRGSSFRVTGPLVVPCLVQPDHLWHDRSTLYTYTHIHTLCIHYTDKQSLLSLLLHTALQTEMF